jgi:hypothetical protein
MITTSALPRSVIIKLLPLGTRYRSVAFSALQKTFGWCATKATGLTIAVDISASPTTYAQLYSLPMFKILTNENHLALRFV